MKLFPGNTRLKAAWENLIHDYLEVKADLSFAKREMLLERLKERAHRADRIYLVPCFSTNGYCIAVHARGMPKEVWIYNPQTNELQALSTKKL